MATSQQKSIGIFDSGMGGLTVAHAIHRCLPNEHLIYFGDTKHLPYGEKSPTTIQQFTKEIVQYLIERNCKAIVIACNSASTAAGTYLQEQFGDKIPLINVVDPLVEKTRNSPYNKVGLIATKATINSNIYQSRLTEQHHLKVVAKATPLLVPVIEEGFAHSDITQAILKEYLGTAEFIGIEALLLACTHYPLVHKALHDILPQVDILDSTKVTAEALQAYLLQHNLCNPSRTRPNEFLVTDYTSNFEQQAEIFFGNDLDLRLISI